MEKKTLQTWMTFETKITELEKQKIEMTQANTIFQEEQKNRILEALVKNEFDTVYALTEELKNQQNTEIVGMDEKIQSLKTRQQELRNKPSVDQEYHDALLQSDPLYTHAIETGDQETVELFKQRKISEKLYQDLMDTYYGNVFDTSKCEWWKITCKKLKLISSDQDVGDILQQMGIDYNTTRVEDFYEPDHQEWWKNPPMKPSKQIRFIKEWNIIQELFTYIQAKNISFEPSEIVLNRKWTTMYIYIQWMDKTVVISNIYGVWTHVYEWKVAINEMQNATIGLLCKKHNGKRIHFGSDFWWMEWRKCRFIKTLGECHERMNLPEREKRDNNPEQKFSSLREKIDDFSARNIHIKHNELNFEDKYEWMITSIKPRDDGPGWRIYINIWKDVFGYCSYRDLKDAKNTRLWDIIRVRAKRIWVKGAPIVFRRPE